MLIKDCSITVEGITVQMVRDRAECPETHTMQTDIRRVSNITECQTPKLSECQTPYYQSVRHLNIMRHSDRVGCLTPKNYATHLGMPDNKMLNH